MKDYTIIFIGKSGSGKGTQIKHLIEYFQTQGEDSIEYVQSGQGIRDFIEQDTYTSKLSRKLNQEGRLYPTFIAIWAWVNNLINTFSGQKVIIVDGAPRKASEARIMDEMFDFYDRKNRIVIHLDVSDTWAMDRLHERKRLDDTIDASITTRLGWFKENAPEILSFFEETGKYTIHTIHGEKSIEEVQKEIIQILNV